MFTENFRETYSKFTYGSYYIDAEEMAHFFIEDLDEYAEKIEVFDDGQWREEFFSKDDIAYRWGQCNTGGVDYIEHGKLSKEQFALGKERVQAFVDSLDIEFEVVTLHESKGNVEYMYRQIIEGVPLSGNQRGNVWM